jgi:ankyrin repeat protein
LICSHSSGLEIADSDTLTTVVALHKVCAFDHLSLVALFRRIQEVTTAVVAAEANTIRGTPFFIAKGSGNKMLVSRFAQYLFHIREDNLSLTSTAPRKTLGKDEAKIHT